MKLLDKQDIQKRKATERKSEVDEGMKLARKVDELRRAGAEEESKLSAFRLMSLKAIQAEIDDRIAARDMLSAEIEGKRAWLKDVNELISKIKTTWK